MEQESSNSLTNKSGSAERSVFGRFASLVYFYCSHYLKMWVFNVIGYEMGQGINNVMF